MTTWTEVVEGAFALLDPTEQLGVPAAYLVVELCCASRDRLRFKRALITLKAVPRPAEAS